MPPSHQTLPPLPSVRSRSQSPSWRASLASILQPVEPDPQDPMSQTPAIQIPSRKRRRVNDQESDSGQGNSRRPRGYDGPRLPPVFTQPPDSFTSTMLLPTPPQSSRLEMSPREGSFDVALSQRLRLVGSSSDVPANGSRRNSSSHSPQYTTAAYVEG